MYSKKRTTGVYYFIAISFVVLLQSCATKPPKQSGVFKDPDLVELIKVDSTLKLDIRYATKNNFTGRAVYTEPRAFLQKPAAEAVAKAVALGKG